MDFLLETVALLFFTLLVLFFIKVHAYLTKNYNYWIERRVPYKKPVFPFGSTKDLVLGKTFIGDGYDKMYKEFVNERYFGIIEVQNPVLILKNLDLVKAVMVKDFNHFTVRTNIGANPKEYILKHVINMSGDEWKEMRALMIPAFSSVKMKSAFSMMEKCSDRLVNYIFKTSAESETIEITDILARFTMDVIATCAFGLETDCISDRNCKFFHAVGAMLKTSQGRFFRRFIINFFPGLVKFLPVKLIPLEVTNILTAAVRDSVAYREKHKLQRNDFLDTLIQTRQNKSTERSRKENVKTNPEENHQGLSIEQITAQAFVFFIAGYTTDTSILSFCLFELARHMDIQEKLHEDIEHAIERHGGLISYQALQDMFYMDQVVNETLRLYGSGQILIRTCTKSYKIPDSDVVLEPGVRVVIPTYSFHHDHKYFPQPYNFDPDRFLPESSRNRHPFAFLPFGEGPRNCIGRSFGLLQIKIGLAFLIHNFQVNLSPNQEVPIKIDERCIVVTPANPVFLRFSQRRAE